MHFSLSTQHVRIRLTFDLFLAKLQLETIICQANGGQALQALGNFIYLQISNIPAHLNPF